MGYIRRDEIFATKLGLSGAFAPVPATATAASASSDSASAETQPLSNEQLLEKKVREPLYLPETVSVIKALEEFRKSKKNFAFVFDEFGNFEGIVTLHDIMEEIAGELPDQTEVPELVRINPGVFKIEGDAILKDVSRLTGFNVPISETYHTIAGFILDYLQRVPEAGEVISMTKWKLEILKVEENTIKSVLLTNLAKAKENEKNQAKAASK